MTTITMAAEKDVTHILPLIQEYFSYTEIGEEELLRRLHSAKFIFHRAEEKQFCGYTEWEIIDAENKIIRLNGIAVLSEFRGKGNSDELLRAGEKIAREKGMKKMILLVAENNSAAKELYTRNKWKFSRAHLKKINGEKTEVWEKNLRGQ